MLPSWKQLKKNQKPKRMINSFNRMMEQFKNHCGKQQETSI